MRQVAPGVFEYGTPAPASAPRSVTNLQARLALLNIGKLSAVEAAINAMSEPQKTAARQTWDFAGTVDRSHPLVVALGPVIGLDASQLDALFVEAAKL